MTALCTGQTTQQLDSKVSKHYQRTLDVHFTAHICFSERIPYIDYPEIDRTILSIISRYIFHAAVIVNAVNAVYLTAKKNIDLNTCKAIVQSYDTKIVRYHFTLSK